MIINWPAYLRTDDSIDAESAETELEGKQNCCCFSRRLVSMYMIVVGCV